MNYTAITHYNGVLLPTYDGYWWHDWGEPLDKTARIEAVAPHARGNRRAWITKYRHNLRGQKPSWLLRMRAGNDDELIVDNRPKMFNGSFDTPEEAVEVFTTIWSLGGPL
jgi:hypothetical protein